MPAYEVQEAIIDNRREVSVCLIPKTRIGVTMITLAKAPRTPRTTRHPLMAPVKQYVAYADGTYAVWGFASESSASADGRWMLKKGVAREVRVNGKEVTL